VLGLWPGKDLDFSNLTAHGGFVPNGVGAIFSGVVIVVFSMVGAEIATIAAAESSDPHKAVVKATNSVIFRVAFFFVGSIFLLVTILPWNSPELGSSPYVGALEEMGIPAAAEIMNGVVLVAVLSCLNSGLYTASRMLFVLSARREAPRWMLDVPAQLLWGDYPVCVPHDLLVAAADAPDHRAHRAGAAATQDVVLPGAHHRRGCGDRRRPHRDVPRG
jgi:GABA permease